MSNIDFKKLGNYVKIRTGKLDANASSEDGLYPFFTCSIEPLKISSYSYDCECCLVAGNGDLNVKYYNGKFDAYQRTYIIESLDKEKLDVMYLYFFLCSYIEVLRKQSIGGVIKYIKLGNLTDALIPIPSLEKQKEICRNLIKAQKILNENQALFSKYDILIKSRFIEMFGDPTTNPMNWDTVNISSLITANASNGFFAKRDEYTEDGNVEVLGVVNIVNTMYSKIDLLPKTNASEKDIKKYSVKYGDMLFCRSSLVAEGIGKASIVPENINKTILFECHVIRLRLDLNKCVPEYMQMLSTTSFFRNQVLKHAKTSTMTTIGQDGILKTDVRLPPIEKQKQFLSFIKQIDKSKFAVQKSLEKTETLYKSLMQTYFG